MSTFWLGRLVIPRPLVPWPSDCRSTVTVPLLWPTVLVLMPTIRCVLSVCWAGRRGVDAEEDAGVVGRAGGEQADRAAVGAGVARQGAGRGVELLAESVVGGGVLDRERGVDRVAHVYVADVDRVGQGISLRE